MPVRYVRAPNSQSKTVGKSLSCTFSMAGVTGVSICSSKTQHWPEIRLGLTLCGRPHNISALSRHMFLVLHVTTWPSSCQYLSAGARITLTESGSSRGPSCGWATLTTVRPCRRRSTSSSVPSPSSTYCAPSSVSSSAVSVEVFAPVVGINARVAATALQLLLQSQLQRYALLVGGVA